jgi:hypothetical protein
MGVGGDRVDLDVEALQLGVVIGNIAEFRRADEGEVSGIKEEDSPLALGIGVGHFNEFSLPESLRFEGLNGCVDKGHGDSFKIAAKRNAAFAPQHKWRPTINEIDKF